MFRYCESVKPPWHVTLLESSWPTLTLYSGILFPVCCEILCIFFGCCESSLLRHKPTIPEAGTHQVVDFFVFLLEGVALQLGSACSVLPSLVFVAYIFLLPTGYKYVGSAGADLIAAEEVVRIMPL